MQNSLFESHIDVDALLTEISDAQLTFLKFLAPNDIGLTGSHQDGIYLPTDCWELFLDAPGPKGENKSEEVYLDWGDGRSDAYFKWYGKSKSEYRLTRVRSYFAQYEERYVGALFVLMSDGPTADMRRTCQARVVEDEDDIIAVLNFLGITPNETNRLLRFDLDERLRPDCEAFLKESGREFPDTDRISKRAQQIHRQLYGNTEQGISKGVVEQPDRAILDLMSIEYSLFRFMERELYRTLLEKPFRDVENFLRMALEINNRRKSRAGRSLENHLAYILQSAGLEFSNTATTEDRKKPDFLFPGMEAYHNPKFPAERLIMLGAKTTCKDRWRQIMSEADRVKQKYIFTLQQGISGAQLNEMRSADVQPVLP
ncbi:MAG: hypothetical protein KDK34_01460, partial [Leptospiraceae bacterium]|nr:hypothetical protein [Leptospiraceae bacterium]